MQGLRPPGPPEGTIWGFSEGRGVTSWCPDVKPDPPPKPRSQELGREAPGPGRFPHSGGSGFQPVNWKITLGSERGDRVTGAGVGPGVQETPVARPGRCWAQTPHCRGRGTLPADQCGNQGAGVTPGDLGCAQLGGRVASSLGPGNTADREAVL